MLIFSLYHTGWNCSLLEMSERYYKNAQTWWNERLHQKHTMGTKLNIVQIQHENFFQKFSELSLSCKVCPPFLLNCLIFPFVGISQIEDQ